MVHIKSILTLFSLIALLILTIVSNVFLQNDKYILTAIIAMLICMVPFFSLFQRKRQTTRELVIIAVMVALCVTSRALFVLIPHFKPLTAMVIITGLYFGKDAGFITGAFSVIVSNFQFGQGPWTIFQMFALGIIGFLAGILNQNGRFSEKTILLSSFAGISGVMFSLIMDIYTTLNTDSMFSLTRYLTYIIAGVPIMVEYIVSNIIFIIILNKTIGNKLNRIRQKYGVFAK